MALPQHVEERRPPLVLVKTQGLSREDWLKVRKSGIGGSDSAAIAGLNRWKSPLMVFLDKTAQIEEPEPGEPAYWGTTLEEVVAQEFTKRTGMKVQRRNAILQSAEWPWMIANIDRLVVGQRAGLEAKTTSAYNAEEWGDDKAPIAYVIQAAHYMAVTGLDCWYMAVLIGGQKFRHLKIDRDEALIENLVKIESGFWHNHVLANVPPAMDGSEASGDLLDRLYPESKPETVIELPPHSEDMVLRFEEAQANEKVWGERKDEAANQLKALLGDYEAGWSGTKKVSWKTVVSNRVDSKALQAKHPSVYADVVKPSSARRFVVK